MGSKHYKSTLTETQYPRPIVAWRTRFKERRRRGRPSANQVHQKLGFTDTDLAENFNLADNKATTDVFYLLIAETSKLRTPLGRPLK